MFTIVVFQTWKNRDVDYQTQIDSGQTAREPVLVQWGQIHFYTARKLFQFFGSVPMNEIAKINVLLVKFS